jgi:hypothetical protein
MERVMAQKTLPGKLETAGLDIVERAGWTAAQQFLSVLLTTSAVSSVIGLPWKLALVMAVGAAVVSVVATLIQYATRLNTHNFWMDLLIRLVKTFLASLAGSFGASHPFNVLTFHWSAALDLAFVATLTALGKGLLARQPGAETPSTLPASHYPPDEKSQENRERERNRQQAEPAVKGAQASPGRPRRPGSGK